MIKRRTAKGIGANGSAFRPLSRGYRLAKQASGRNPVPDLRLSGQMLNNLKVLQIVGPKLALIGFEGTHRVSQLKATGKAALFSTLDTKRGIRKRTRKKSKATIPMATIVRANHRLRPFFDITRADEKKALRDVYRKALQAETAAATRR